jgi:hypothetical protein
MSYIDPGPTRQLVSTETLTVMPTAPGVRVDLCVRVAIAEGVRVGLGIRVAVDVDVRVDRGVRVRRCVGEPPELSPPAVGATLPRLQAETKVNKNDAMMSSSIFLNIYAPLPLNARLFIVKLYPSLTTSPSRRGEPGAFLVFKFHFLLPLRDIFKARQVLWGQPLFETD